MARVPFTIDHIRAGKYVLNVEPDASWIVRPRWDTLTPQQQSVVCADLPGLCYRAMVAKRHLERNPVQAGRICRKWRETRIFDLSAATERLSNRPHPTVRTILNPCGVIPTPRLHLGPDGNLVITRLI